ncbi:MAG: hypothetical protein RR291_05235, partial [Clostridia bacterium]
MFESLISVDKENAYFLDYLETKLSPAIIKTNGIQLRMDNKKRCYLSVACAELYKKQIEEILTSLLLRVFSIGYKNIYFKNRLRPDKNDLAINTLINTMCIFDSNMDNALIKRNLDSLNSVYLDGFYNFRMKKVKEKWDEVVSLTSNNEVVLRDDDILKEFLSYLINVMPYGNSLSLLVMKDGYELFDDENKLIPKCETVTSDCTLEEDIIFNLI